MDDPNGFGLWRERRAGLQRETESYRLAHRLRTALREESTRQPCRARRPRYRIREAPRITGEAT